MKVLVSGSRKWVAQVPIERELLKLPPGTILIHGDCDGVDHIAADVARRLGMTVRGYPAIAKGRTWPTAGPLRNQEMLDMEHPSPDGQFIDLALLFHQDPNLGRGTRGMKKLLDEALPVITVVVHRRLT
jgi:hypothetical protein